MPEGATRILAFAGETPNAILDLPTYRSASARLEALVASETPLNATFAAGQRDSQALRRRPVALSRDLTLIAAGACEVIALDGPFARFEDLDGLRANAAAARACGFNGKIAIDPKQVEIINEIFG